MNTRSGRLVGLRCRHLNPPSRTNRNSTAAGFIMSIDAADNPAPLAAFPVTALYPFAPPVLPRLPNWTDAGNAAGCADIFPRIVLGLLSRTVVAGSDRLNERVSLDHDLSPKGEIVHAFEYMGRYCGRQPDKHGFIAGIALRRTYTPLGKETGRRRGGGSP